ncbi:MAG TPA: hypothetical protein VK465_04015, partial [Fibrobacteria bacterium]|nr:hypothetical protein [Fibrobacteria bacterium]
GSAFPTWERDPRLWMDLGYTSTLRSMDMLLSLLGARDSASATATRPASGKSLPPPPPPLGLNRLTVNPLASGGSQLLQDILKRSVADRGDSAGEGALSDLVGSGYYSNLDVEWTRPQGEGDPTLIFDALEKSRLLLQVGGNMANSGEDLPDRGPEILAGVVWSEPFYVPIRAEATLLLGGHRPGMSVRGLMAPVSPLPLEVGMSLKDWRIRYPAPSGSDLDLDPRGFRLNRTRSDLFLNLMPSPNFRTGTAIQWHKLRYPEWDLDRGQAEIEVERLLEPSTGTGEYQSVDFEQTMLWGLGRIGPSGLNRNSLWVRYRNLNRVNVLGTVRGSTSSIETRVRASLGDFRFLDQYHWSDLDGEDAGLFEYLEAGEVSAFSFQDDRFYRVLRATHFQNLQAEYAPAFGRFGLRLMAGAFRLYGHPLTEGLEFDFTRIYWEAQASYATPLGPFRLGFAGLEDGSPLFFVKVGADLDLDPEGPER